MAKHGYLEIGQRNCFHEIKAEGNAEKVLQDPDPPVKTWNSLNCARDTDTR